MVKPPYKSIWFLKLGVMGFVLGLYWLLPGVHEFIETGFSYLKIHDFIGLRKFILSYGIWAPLTSIFLMTVQSLVPVVPGLAITITNAWIFGWTYGALYSWTGALLGAVLDFGIARWYGRPFVESFIPTPMVAKGDTFFRKNGVMAVFITRLVPIIPFKVISYCAGLTSISLCEYMFATGVGQTPAIILYSVLGENLTHSVTAMVIITTCLTVTALVTFFFREDIEKYLFTKKEEKNS